MASPRDSFHRKNPSAKFALIRILFPPNTTSWDMAGSKFSPSQAAINFHGQFQVNGNDSAFNSPNPFGGANQPGYDTTQFSGNVSGPIKQESLVLL